MSSCSGSIPAFLYCQRVLLPTNIITLFLELLLFCLFVCLFVACIALIYVDKVNFLGIVIKYLDDDGDVVGGLVIRKSGIETNFKLN